MKRRSFLAFLGTIPFVGRIVPQPQPDPEWWDGSQVGWQQGSCVGHRITMPTVRKAHVQLQILQNDNVKISNVRGLLEMEPGDEVLCYPEGGEWKWKKIKAEQSHPDS